MGVTQLLRYHQERQGVEEEDDAALPANWDAAVDPLPSNDNGAGRHVRSHRRCPLNGIGAAHANRIGDSHERGCCRAGGQRPTSSGQLYVGYVEEAEGFLSFQNRLAGHVAGVVV